MRQISRFIGALLSLLSICAVGARAETIVRLHADRIAFYYDRFLIEADGHVRVTTSDGATITGDTLSMDLKLNRFLIASNVHLTSPGGNISGAAISDFLDFNRTYFLPVIAKPDRWTYENGDYRHPLKGREMPGDVFYFPDLSSAKVSLIAKSATIGAKSFARFGGVTSYIFGLGAPLPSYYVYFGSNSDMGVNSLAGANLDLTYNVAGNNNSISALHLRSDHLNGVYGSIEQHFTDRNGYEVISDNPGTKRQHYWSLVFDRHIGKRFQINDFSQLYNDQQQTFSNPYASSQWSYLYGTYAFPQSFLQLQAKFINFNLLGEGLPKASPARPNHPVYLTATWTAFDHRIGKLPLFDRLTYGVGVDHDAYGLTTYGGYQYTTIWNHELGWTFYVPGIKFGDRENGYRTYYFNASWSKNYTWYSAPYYLVRDDTVGSISRQYSREVSAYISYEVANSGIYYRQGGYSLTTPPVVDGVPVYSFLAFRGVSTARTFTAAGTYSATPNLVATVTYQHHDDFPIPYPGLFALPPLNNLGQPQYANYLGQPPNNIMGEVRFLAIPHVVLDISRSYYFNYGNLRWSPQTNVQVIGQ